MIITHNYSVRMPGMQALFTARRERENDYFCFLVKVRRQFVQTKILLPVLPELELAEPVLKSRVHWRLAFFLREAVGL